MPADNDYRLNSCSDNSNESSLYGNSVYSEKDRKSDGDFHLAPTDFSNFDQTESMQMVPPTVRTAQCLTTRNSALGDKSQQFVSKCNNIELRIVRQPEEQHRARYMSEGSRGSVKDKSGKSFCTVQLLGYSRPTVLEIFASTTHGAAQPHPLYQVIGVTGKSGSATHCREITGENGANCLQVVLRPENNMTAVLDCIGILKICSYNLKRKLSKQNRSSTVRLAFRASVPHPTNKKQVLNLQTVSTPIVCVQQLGYPDVTKISKRAAFSKGGSEIFIIGKNFASNSVVFFREYDSNGCIIWSTEANVEKSTRHSCHLVCYTPSYRRLDISSPVEVYLTVECGSKVSRPISFTYLPIATEILKPISTPCVLSPNPTSTIFGSDNFSSMDEDMLSAAEIPAVEEATRSISESMDVNVSPLESLVCQQNSFPAELLPVDLPVVNEPSTSTSTSTSSSSSSSSTSSTLSSSTATTTTTTTTVVTVTKKLSSATGVKDVPPLIIQPTPFPADSLNTPTVLPNNSLPSLVLGYPGQLASIDACIGINDKDTTSCQGYNLVPNMLTTFNDPMLTSLYSDLDIL